MPPFPFPVGNRARLGTRLSSVDANGLREELARAVEGEVRFDALNRALYASDASNFRQPPIGVVIPRSVDDIAAAHRVCREYGAPITARGTGTSLAGQAVNRAVILDLSRHLTAIGDVDAGARTVRAEPGAINGRVSRAARRSGLVFGPDPSSHAHCTIGGNVGTNACGAHSVQADLFGPGPRTSDNVESLEVLTYDGLRLTVGPTPAAALDAILAAGGRRATIYRGLAELADRYAGLIRERFPQLPRRVSGYNLDELLPENGFNVARALVGTEGTCV
ncbi:MAG TPA: FAD-binding oxidoreductase, partial [Actinomycetota bacterium]|nr:FAD-binding oxidoreductase [Actinomycetota bacterium]